MFFVLQSPHGLPAEVYVLNIDTIKSFNRNYIRASFDLDCRSAHSRILFSMRKSVVIGTRRNSTGRPYFIETKTGHCMAKAVQPIC